MPSKQETRSSKQVSLLSLIPLLILVLISTILFLAFTNVSKVDYDLIFDKYYSFNRVPSDYVTDKNKFAFIEYQNRNHQAASFEFETLVHSSKTSDELILFTGLNYIENKDYSKANNLFTWFIINYPKSKIIDNVKWHNALVLLKINDYNEARNLLIDLSKSDGRYKANAQKLLDEIL